MAHVMAGVDAGSVALLLALVLYQIGSRRPERTSSRHASALQRSYAALLVVLGGSVLLGTFLAGAGPLAAAPAPGSAWARGQQRLSARPDGAPSTLTASWVHARPSRSRSHPMTKHPFYDQAEALARVFVVGMTVTAYLALPVMLAIALL